MQRIIRQVLVVLLAVAWQASAVEVALQNLDAAAFQPGKLRLALTVTERSGVARKDALVTSGVPFPPGFLVDAARLAVVDESGKPVVCQAEALNKWYKPAYDDSVQWALVSFLSDAPAGGTKTYYLVDDGKTVSPASPLKLTRGAKAVIVETGAAQFIVPLQGEALILRALIGGVEVIAGEGLRGTVTVGEWPELGLKAGSRLTTRHDGVTVEESGPARVVLCLKGTFAPGDKNGRFYDYTARLCFAAGDPSVRVVYTISNGKLDATLTDGWRQHYVWPIEDASLVADLSLGAGAQATTLAEGKDVSGGDLLVYQDSSGGEKWQDLGGGNYEGWLSRYTEGKSVRGVTFRGYKVTGGGKDLAAGNSHPGVLAVSSGKAGITAALRNFRVEYPHALTGNAKTLRVGLFPGEFAEPFHLNLGQRKSYDLRLTLHGATAPALADCFAQQDALLLFRADPAWMVRAAAQGAWSTGLALVKDARAGARPARRDAVKLDGINTGWDWYGWVSGWNSAGDHWNENTCFAQWVLWGDGASFDAAEASALWAADLCAIHYDNPDIPALWLYMMDWNMNEPRIKMLTYPGWYNRDTWGRPDSGHMAMYMWPEYYYLTGDMRVREAVQHLGERARAMHWKSTHDDRADGTGPMRTAVNWCKKRDPDADPTFRLFTRYEGWPLFDLAQWYRIDGRPELLDECRTVARAFRNSARYSPIGFMCLQINPKGSKEVYGGQGPFEKNRDLSASACYAHFQMAIMATGLQEYYLMSRDQEALDALTGFADLMTHHCMLRDPAGKRQAWTYAFGDYWGPYTWEDTGGKPGSWMNSNFYVVQVLGWVYRLTGRTDYLEVVQDAVETLRGQPSVGIIGAHMVQAHPKAEAQAPAAVGDLTATALGGGKVRLTWTAPRGAAAVRYQVKMSSARIVERVKGWPDRTEPLPKDREEWEARAAAFHARERAFWAADNVAGAPVPAAPGKTETMEIGGLPAGTRHFALKSWTAADNVGDLSNVVMLDVK
jgi:hypothetical protein